MGIWCAAPSDAVINCLFSRRLECEWLGLNKRPFLIDELHEPSARLANNGHQLLSRQVMAVEREVTTALHQASSAERWADWAEREAVKVEGPHANSLKATV